MRARPGALPVRVVRMRSRDAGRIRSDLKRLLDRPPHPEALRRYLADRRNVFLLASIGDVPVGFLRGTALAQVETLRPQMFLYEVGVERAHRRRGAGRALVEALLDHCRARRFEEVFVFTDPGNRPAVTLYRHTGAVTETPRDRMYVYRLRRRPRT